MVGFKITIKDTDGILDQLKELPKRLDSLRIELGNTIASEIKTDVAKRIPTGSKWMEIYRKAIDVSFNGEKEWVVAGEAKLPITVVDAKVTLILFGVEDRASKLLSNYNPWPIDLVPGINAVYSSRIVMKQASEAEVTICRDRLVLKLDLIKKNLEKNGFSIIPGELPKFGGNTVADLSFLAQRLEYGLGGMPRTPIWRNATDKITADIATAIKFSKDRFEKILRGEISKRPKDYSPELKSMLASAVRRAPGE